MELHDGLGGNARTGIHLKLRHIGIGHQEVLHRCDVCLEHPLVDMAGGEGLLVDDKTNV